MASPIFQTELERSLNQSLAEMKTPLKRLKTKMLQYSTLTDHLILKANNR